MYCICVTCSDTIVIAKLKNMPTFSPKKTSVGHITMTFFFRKHNIIVLRKSGIDDII